MNTALIFVIVIVVVVSSLFTSTSNLSAFSTASAISFNPSCNNCSICSLSVGVTGSVFSASFKEPYLIIFVIGVGLYLIIAFSFSNFVYFY